ncbi:acid-sensing ion channel 2-like isoform X2 [Acropora muricata]|uniref:acid-sensing ion channel 2-like isoform X2 n=1 Tax=Acropora muricata TaxID=159855 RepID=UPI0034E5C09B
MTTIWEEFVSSTTVHGFRRIFESPSRVFRAMWLVLLLAALTGYTFFVLESIEKYLSNPVTVSFTEVVPEPGELKFPAVTICNLNRYVKSKIEMLESDEEFDELRLNLSVCEVVKSVTENLTCGQALLCVFERFGSIIVRNCNDTVKQQIIDALNATNQPVFDAEEFMEAYGHDFNDMFLKYCRFGKRESPCSVTDFHPFLTANGRCFTFNSGEEGSRIRISKRAGSFSGLSVMLDVQAQENTVSEFSRGLRVIVHDQGTFVDTEDGFNVSPGSHTLVSISAKKFIRLPFPFHSNCTRRSLPQIPRYTRNGCFIQCQANRTGSMCGCRQIGVQESPNRRSCECNVPCEEVEFTTDVSYSEFPDEGIRKVLKHIFNYNDSIEHQRRNLVFLQVAFHRYVYSLQKEEPSYRMGSLFGDLGGNMGLFLGCSLLTLFEFVDLFWNLLQSRANKIKIKLRETENPGIA